MLSGTRMPDYSSRGSDLGAGSAKSGSLRQGIESVTEHDDSFFSTGKTEDEFDLNYRTNKNKIETVPKIPNTQMTPTTQQVQANHGDQFDMDKKPVDKFDKDKKPIEKIDTEKNAAEKLEKDKKPAEQFGKEKKPAEQFDKDKKPVEQFEKDKKPVEQFEKEKKPAEGFDKNKKPAAKLDNDKKPAEKIDKDKKLADKFDLDKKPSDQFDMNKYKSKRGNLDMISKKGSTVGDSSVSKQSTAVDLVKASYKLTEDVLDPDKSNEPWVNSARENKAGNVVCSFHQDSPVIMHCKTCDRLVCDECITSSHKPHDLIEIRKQGLQDKLILTEKLPDVKIRAIPSLKKNLDVLRQTKAKSSEEFDNMINQIKQRSSALITAIEKARDHLIGRCISDRDASHTFLNKLEDKLTAGVVEIESSAKSSEEAIKMDKDSPIVHERIKLQWLLDKYRKSHPHIIYPKFQNGTAAREEATLEKMIGYFDGTLKCEARDQLHKIMLNVTPLGSLKPSYLRTLPYVHKVRSACAAGDDRVCIVPVVPVTSLDILTSEGVSVLTQVPHTRIYDITRTMDSHFLVSDPRSRKVMRITQNGVVVKWTNVNGIPRGLHACKNGDILLCVVDSVAFHQSSNSSRHVVRMNENFNIIETYGRNEHIFNIPDRIFENVNGDICVIDRFGGLDSRLIVLDSHGSVRFEFPGEGGFDGTYGEGYLPVKRQAFSDVCCDGYANIYISDERNSEIIVLDADGTEQKSVADIFTKKRDKVENNIVAPHRIVVDQNGRLWVIQRRKIALFSLYNY